MKSLSWKTIILFSSMLIALAIVIASFSPVESQGRGSSFMITGNGDSVFVWRVNVVTGAVSYCVRKDNSVDERFIAGRSPYCSAQSSPVQ